MQASDIIQLKSLKVHEDMSQETLCFSANIYMDGKQVGDVRNDGIGGCNMIHIKPESRKAFDAAVEKYKAECKPQFEAEVDGQLIDAVIEEMRLAKDMKTKTLFKEGKLIREINELYTPELKAYILKNHPTAFILNKDFAPQAAVQKKENQRLRRLCKTNIMFKLKGEKGNRKVKLTGNQRSDLVRNIYIKQRKAKHGDKLEVVYNETLG